MTKSNNPTADFLGFASDLVSLATDISTPSLLPKTGTLLSYAAGCGARAVITNKDFMVDDGSAPASLIKEAHGILCRARSMFALLGNSPCDGYPWTTGRENFSATTCFELCHTMDSSAHVFYQLESARSLTEISTTDATHLLKSGLACSLNFERHLELDGHAPPQVATKFAAQLKESLQTWATVFGLDVERAQNKIFDLEEGDLFKLMNKCDRAKPTDPQGLTLAQVHDFYDAQGLKFKMQSQFTLVHDSGLRILGKPILVKAVQVKDDDVSILNFSTSLFTLPPAGSSAHTAALTWMLKEQERCADHVRIQLVMDNDALQCLVSAKTEWPTNLNEIPSLRGFVGFLGLLLDHGGEFGLGEQAA
jgi:hypothetical protein